MKYNTILFDLDGTLIDPKLGITSGVQYALAMYGINEDREVLTPFIGPPMNQSFKEFYNFDDKKAMEAVQHFRDYYIPKGLYESTVFRGIPELLEKLKNAKKKLYVVTHKPGRQAEKIMQFHNIFEYFDGVKGPKPDLIDTAKGVLMRETLSLLPNEKTHSIVMVGDRKYDIEAAQENEIDSIGVTFGYGSHDEIKDSNPTHMVHTVKELSELLLE